MPYTQEEINNSSTKLVLSTIPRGYDTLGPRTTQETYDNMLSSAAGVFLLQPTAVYYVESLACLRLLEQIQTEVEVIGEILSNINSLGNKNLPIQDLTPLFNASAALQELGNAISVRLTSFNSTSVPALQRFSSNINQFLKTSGNTTISSSEARANIPQLISSWEKQHNSLVSSVKLLENSYNNYLSLNLPFLVAQKVISNATDLIGNIAGSLAVLRPEDREKDIRLQTLDLLSSAALVPVYTTFSPPGAFSLVGVGMAFSDSSHLAAPAVLQSALPGSYGVVEGYNVLDFYPLVSSATYAVSTTTGVNDLEAVFTGIFAVVTPGSVVYVSSGTNNNTRWVVKTSSPTTLLCSGQVNAVPEGNTIHVYPPSPVSVTLTPSNICHINGFLGEPYNIHLAGGGFTDNSTLIFSIDADLVTVSLTLGMRTAQNIVDDINPSIAFFAPGKDIQAETYLSPLRFDSVVSISSLGFGSFAFTILSGSFDSLGISTGQILRVMSGPDTGTELSITLVSSLVIHASGSLFSFTNQEIQIGDSHYIRLASTNDQVNISLGTTISMSTLSSNTAGSSLGLLGTDKSTKTTVKDMVNTINSQGKPYLASRTLVPEFTGQLNTDVLFPLLLKALYFTGTTSVTASGLNITLSGLFPLVPVGSTICVRDGTNFVFTVLTANSSVITGVGSFGTVTQTVLVDIGPTLVNTNAVSISSGPNQGDYVVSIGGVPFELTSTTTIPFRGVNTTPSINSGICGSEYVLFNSTDVTTNSVVFLRGSALYLFFSLPPIARAGTTPWFLLPSKQSVSIGDKLETFGTVYNIPDNTYLISAIEGNIIQLDKNIGSTESWSFSGSVPFASLVSGNIDNISFLTSSLSAWLGNTNMNYFQDLARFINPLLANTNTTAGEINDATNRILAMLGTISISSAEQQSLDPANTLEGILSGYSAPVVPDVNTLITAFLEKGADRAIDILLSGDYQSFFGLSYQVSSYSADLQSAVRALAVNDLPVGKNNRAQTNQGQLIVSTTSPDYAAGGVTDDQNTTTVDPPTS